MKILVIHNLHRAGSASGDDEVFKNETALLKEKGHQVQTYTVQNNEFDNSNLAGKAAATLGMFWSNKHYNAVEKLIDSFHPDLVHVHTFFPLMSPSILYAAKNKGVPVTATLHDTRFICPCATSLHKGKICNECLDGKYFRMVKKKCFKDSAFQSAVVASVFKTHRQMKSFYNQIDSYITLNDEQISLLKNNGFDASRIFKKYNFVKPPVISNDSLGEYNLPKRYVVFYGRIGEEKGIRELMEIWESLDDIDLVVMGKGPLEEEFSKWASKKQNVHFLGYTQHDICLEIVQNAQFVVFPSIWYEGCSMVVVETESTGTPLIATDLGFMKEAIQDGKNGMKVSLGDIQGFAKKIRYLWNHPELCAQMGQNAFAEYEEKFKPEQNYEQLMNIYKQTIKRFLDEKL